MEFDGAFQKIMKLKLLQIHTLNGKNISTIIEFFLTFS